VFRRSLHTLLEEFRPCFTAPTFQTFAFLVTGSVIVETVFNIPGIGRAFVTSVESYDYPMILGTTVLFSIVIAIANLIVDIAYVFIDPRVRLT